MRPLQDAFTALFFVAMGMLFDPQILVKQPLQVLAVLAIIVLGKSVVAFLVVVLLGRPVGSALVVQPPPERENAPPGSPANAESAE